MEVWGWLSRREHRELLGSVNGGWGRASHAETVDSDAPMVRFQAHSSLSSGFWPFSDCDI